jgi:hypothetical protein
VSQFNGRRGDAVISIKVGDIFSAVLEGIRLAGGSPDDVAIAQNTCCEVEKRANIHPRKD